ncbi:MAG: nitronate monooxygenase [Ignavibacteriales bacterium]|nr:nitronate monooxygenase [Ignavibacteriales bacterium]
MNRIIEILQIKYPIIQGGMVWVSGWKLASAVSNNGGLGLIGSGSMKPELLREHIQKCKSATFNSYGVNLPLLRDDAEDLAKVIIEENVKIVFTSAGHPGKFIDQFKKNNIRVVHVVPNIKFALKAESVGCDAVVGEGVEAGGHNGIDELTTFSLIPQLVDNLKIPVIAAGGISDGRGILAALSLGAEGVQIGTRFAVTQESSAHENYKQAVVNANDKDTHLILKNLGMARVIKNKFSTEISIMENNCSDLETQKELLGKKREMKGIFEGNIEEGMIEASQSSGLIKDIPYVEMLMKALINQYNEAYKKLKLF